MSLGKTRETGSAPEDKVNGTADTPPPDPATTEATQHRSRPAALKRRTLHEAGVFMQQSQDVGAVASLSPSERWRHAAAGLDYADELAEQRAREERIEQRAAAIVADPDYAGDLATYLTETPEGCRALHALMHATKDNWISALADYQQQIAAVARHIATSEDARSYPQ